MLEEDFKKTISDRTCVLFEVLYLLEDSENAKQFFERLPDQADQIENMKEANKLEFGQKLLIMKSLLSLLSVNKDIFLDEEMKRNMMKYVGFLPFIELLSEFLEFEKEGVNKKLRIMSSAYRNISNERLVSIGRAYNSSLETCLN